ncbi:MAG: response regulator, partial [Planctomycetes bacterium]|nr:response regulator [Planctomycetota bacterium]
MVVPGEILAQPLSLGNKVQGVLLLCSVQPLSETSLEFLDKAGEHIAIALLVSLNQEKIRLALEETRRQQEELRVSNEQLEEQTQRLKSSEEELKQQSEELQVTNEELSEKGRVLELQNQIVEKNRQALEIKSVELERASRYKSEFLANMSHELRTPLNSLLILSQTLTENREGNLNERQVKDAQVIYEGGRDLLNLINDILDLSKVEAGRLDILIEEVSCEQVFNNLRRQFGPLAQKQKLSFKLLKDADAPTSFFSDSKRLEQILKNFLSNAFKFTAAGEIGVRFHRPDARVNFLNKALNAENALAFSVSDTGPGIAQDKQQLIFEAFRQEDGSVSRKYGGTGLGLTISREMAKLLGGEVMLESAPGSGSTFTLYLPLSRPASAPSPEAPAVPETPAAREAPAAPAAERMAGPEEDVFIADDRDKLKVGSRSLLIIDDDRDFARILMDLCRKKGYLCLCAGSGRQGILLAQHFAPSAILLDLGLPDIDGLVVLEQLKQHPRTQALPVHIISASD